MLVYKYLSSERINVLEDSRIRFTQPASLNDPFECLTCTEELQKYHLTLLPEVSAQSFADSSSFEEFLQEREDRVRQAANLLPNILGETYCFLSLSKKRDNLLMWSHYAECHTGFVVGFDSNSSFFQPGNGKTVDGLREVLYSQDRTVVPGVDWNRLSPEELRNVNNAIFFTKSSHWSYEEELRILSHPHDADFRMPLLNAPDVYLFNFPSDSVKEVILGLRMDTEKKQAIISIVSNKYSHANIFQAELDRYQFALQINPYTEPASEAGKLRYRVEIER